MLETVNFCDIFDRWRRKGILGEYVVSFGKCSKHKQKKKYTALSWLYWVSVDEKETKTIKQAKCSLMALLNIRDSELNFIPYMSTTVTKVNKNPVLCGYLALSGCEQSTVWQWCSTSMEMTAGRWIYE